MAAEEQHTHTPFSLPETQISPFAKISQLPRRTLVKQTNDVQEEMLTGQPQIYRIVNHRAGERADNAVCHCSVVFEIWVGFWSSASQTFVLQPCALVIYKPLCSVRN